jgi:EAL domain-containing protein (putative c-di-GMP-specific phosphodiesterase class I)
VARRRTRTARDSGSLPTSVLDRAAWFESQLPEWLAALLVAALLAGTYMVVYASGGTQPSFAHLFYIPIIVSVLFLGLRGCVVTSLVATVLCGPLMPLDTSSGETQQVGSWVFRGVMFLFIGLSAYLSVAIHLRLTEQELSSEVRDAIMLSGVPSTEIDESLLPLVADVLADRRFHPVFQPVYSLADGALLAVEALTRFDPEPYRTPDRWFAAATLAGIGTDLEIAAIEEAMAATGDLPPGVVLSLNASPATLGDQRLLDLIRGTERQLVVEITEHAVVEDYHLLQDTVHVLRDLGVRIAVDDAGAGISSLRHIVQLAPEVIKLDISLTQGVGTSTLRRTLAGTLIDFARRTGAELIVEGIEEISDLDTWTLLGADAVQGFLVGRPGPLPVAAFSGLIVTQRGACV